MFHTEHIHQKHHDLIHCTDNSVSIQLYMTTSEISLQQLQLMPKHQVLHKCSSKTLKKTIT